MQVGISFRGMVTQVQTVGHKIMAQLGCAGEIGMAKSNNQCGVRVAYECNLGGLKIDFNSSSDLQTADVLRHNSSYIDVYSNSWGPDDSGFSIGGPGHLTLLTLETGAKNVNPRENKIVHISYNAYI